MKNKEEYDEEDAKDWSVNISDKVREAITKELNLPRYKIIVQINKILTFFKNIES